MSRFAGRALGGTGLLKRIALPSPPTRESSRLTFLLTRSQRPPRRRDGAVVRRDVEADEHKQDGDGRAGTQVGWRASQSLTSPEVSAKADNLPALQASDLDLPTVSRLQSLQTRSYFYGGPPLTQGLLSPFSIIVRLSDIRIVRVGEVAGTHAPDSALPLGATRLTRDTELVEVDLEGPRAASEVVNRILAVPMAEEERDGQEKVVKGPVMGFVWV